MKATIIFGIAVTLLGGIPCAAQVTTVTTNPSASVTHPRKQLEDKTPYLKKRSFEINGTFSLTQEGDANGDINQNISVMPSIQYFILNRLSVGATLQYQHTQSTGYYAQALYDKYGIGPSANYYFWVVKSAAFFVEGGALMTQLTSTGMTYTSALGALGVKLFIIPQVALGLQYGYIFPVSNNLSYVSQTSINGGLSYFF